MKVSCDVVIDFDDEKQANTVLKSIEIDNFDFVKSKTSGKKLIYLACVSVAVKVVDKN